MPCRVKIHDKGIGDLLQTPQAKRHVTVAAGEIARAAAAIAPRRSGRLAKSYRSTKAEVTPNGLSARAYTAMPYGHLVEWGSVGQAPKAPLRRGAQRAGYRLKITPKGGG